MRRFLAVAALLAGSIAAAQKPPPPNADDRISDQVRMRLATDPDVKGGALDVIVKDGVVTIRGRVDTEKGRDRATKLTKKVKGVKEVDNELVVGPPK
jgi:osmotically-inducible protein OsmY